MKSKSRLLIIEDDKGIADLYAKYFSKNTDITVDCAYSGEEAAKALEEKEYRYILLDIGLPDIHGYELVPMIRRLSREAVIVVVTGLSDREFVVESLNVGVDAFVDKPASAALIQTAFEAREADFERRCSEKSRIILDDYIRENSGGK
jgi:DNA-binding response OmpR family regulator